MNLGEPYGSKFIGSNDSSARCNYRRFVEKGADEGRRTKLTGGGRIRSAGEVGRWSSSLVEQTYNLMSVPMPLFLWDAYSMLCFQ